MNEEEAFLTAIGGNPEDHVTRLVFADWLQERGDPRADGYRALGVNRLRPRFYENHFKWYNAKDQRGGIDVASDLPPDWYRAIRKSKLLQPSGKASAKFQTRTHAEDAAALAFAKLPAKRHAALLAGPKTTPSRT